MKKRWFFSMALCLMLLAVLAVPASATGEGGGDHTHAYGAWTVTADSHSRTCSCGATDSGTHSWSTSETKATCNTKGSIVKTCGVCGSTNTTETAATGAHTYGTWSKQDDVNHVRTCSGCSQSQVSAHTWDGGKYIKDPSCKEEGQISYTCTSCAATRTSSVAKLTNHTYDNSCDPDCNVCGTKRNAGHKATTYWSKRSSGHYHVCLTCGQELDVASHYPGPAATEEKPQVCLTCGYVMTPVKNHTHSFQDGMQSDESGHWKSCTTCQEQVDWAAHSFDGNCDDTCDTCGYVNEFAHTYEDVFHTDEISHWVECTLCGKAGSKEAHIPGAAAEEGKPQSCVVCGAELSPAIAHVHLAGEDWYSDEESHWYECSCGEKMEQETHSWDQGAENPDGSVTYLCTLCGEAFTQEAEPEEAPEAAGFPWVAVCLVAVGAAVAGAVAAVVIMNLGGKKSGGRFSK